MAGVKGRSGGHNAKTRKQHELEGTFQKARHGGHRNPDPPDGTPEKPAGLKGEAAAEWDRMIVRLTACKTLSTVDDAVLERYCRLHARAARLETALESEPPFLDKVTVDGAGQEHVERKVHPGFAQCRQHDLALRLYLTEFGLTPASRGRVKLPEKPPAEADPFAEFDESIH